MTTWRYLREEEKPSNVVGGDQGMTKVSPKSTTGGELEADLFHMIKASPHVTRCLGL